MHAGGGGGGGFSVIFPVKKRARIAIEGPDSSAVNFDEVQTKDQANQIVDCIAVSESLLLGILGVGDLTFGVGYPPPPPPSV